MLLINEHTSTNKSSLPKAVSSTNERPATATGHRPVDSPMSAGHIRRFPTVARRPLSTNRPIGHLSGLSHSSCLGRPHPPAPSGCPSAPIQPSSPPVISVGYNHIAGPIRRPPPSASSAKPSASSVGHRRRPYPPAPPPPPPPPHPPPHPPPPPRVTVWRFLSVYLGSFRHDHHFNVLGRYVCVLVPCSMFMTSIFSSQHNVKRLLFSWP